MRLIDADEFKDYIIDSFESYKLLTDEYRDFARDIFRGFLKDIDAQPTAYNLEGVIDQSEYFKKITHEPQAYIAACNAIEMVKKGGIKRSFK